MKIAVISDIHGNFQALDSVLEDMRKNHAEQVFCLGDLAMAGPQPRLIIDLISKKSDWVVIQGNTDKMVFALADDVYFFEDDMMLYLKNLPAQKEVEVEGVKVLLVHGSPRRNNEDILPDLPIKKVEEMIEGTNADVIFCGHTHIPCGYQTSRKQTIVNVGSVGRPFTEDPKACYVLAEFQDGGFSIEHRFVDYDREMAANILRSRDFEGSDKLAQMLISPSSRHL